MPLSFDRRDGDIQGYSPKQLRAAYSVSGVASGLPIIGIVDAYGYYPNGFTSARQDLNAYSKQFNLPILPKCKGAIVQSAVPCFQAVNQKGGHKLPTTIDQGWAAEQAIDVQVAHALCENCSILLVEANTNGIADLFSAENTGAKLGANVMSNSWGSSEFSGESSADAQFFTHPGVVMTAGTGDDGYAGGVFYPASSPNVVAVGGTSLFLKNGKKYLSEAAWSGAGSGCSEFESRPTWQPSLPGCPANRTVGDIAMDADPNTGVAICTGCTTCCWQMFGGTSIGTPIVAGMFAIAGRIPQDTTEPSGILYENVSKTNSRDIVGGSTGDCDFAYLCNAVPGYDGPTGLGSPKGLDIFIAP